RELDSSNIANPSQGCHSLRHLAVQRGVEAGARAITTPEGSRPVIDCTMPPTAGHGRRCRDATTVEQAPPTRARKETPMPPNHPTARTFYTVREAAAELRVNKNTLYRAIHDGAFPAVKIRSRFVVPVKAIDQLLERALETGQPVDPARIAAEHR